MAETLGQTRADFPFFMDIPTRWMDNDAYGHVNNVQYYSFFDSLVNAHLVRFGGLDANTSPVIGLVVESKCQFKKSLHFPGTVNCGLRCVKIGRTSVTYEIGCFGKATRKSPPSAISSTSMSNGSAKHRRQSRRNGGWRWSRCWSPPAIRSHLVKTAGGLAGGPGAAHRPQLAMVTPPYGRGWGWL